MEWEMTPSGQLIQRIKKTIRSEMQVMDRRSVTEDKTEIIKVYDRLKG